MFLFRLLKYFEGPYEVVGTVVLPAAFFAAMFFWPLLDRNPRCDPRRRPLAIALLVLATAGLLGSTIYAIATDVRLPAPAMAAKLEPSVPPPAGPIQRLQIARLYHDDCSACHGDDGSGSLVRAAMPSIPDFRNMAWQTTKTDFEIIHQIQAGKEPLMPTFRSKLSKEQILGLAIFLRAFAVMPAAGSRLAPVAGQPPGEVPPNLRSPRTSEVSPAKAQGIPPVAPRETPPSSHQPSIRRLAAPILFRDLCMACHGTDGRGTPVRPAMPTIPDFTKSKWQHSRTDGELQHSILEGKGTFMLPMKNKVDAAGAKDLVAYVRNFTGGKQVVAVERPPQIVVRPASPKVAETIPKSEILLPVPTTGAELPAVTGPELTARPSPSETAEQIHLAVALYRQNCLTCHGADGRGTTMRVSMPSIPDFTDSLWQRSHSSAELTASIQSGKGVFMPAFGQRLKPGEIRDVLAYVRAFGPPAPAPARPEATDSERQFRELQRRWNELDRQFKELSHEPAKP
jgi:mono/diheme cytochrome c family protein